MWDVREYSLAVPGRPTLTLRARVGRPGTASSYSRTSHILGWFSYITAKPIFHWKLRSLTNANEMNTNNMESTWPMPALRLGTQRDLDSTCSRWGFVLEVTQILGFALAQGFLDTNMLVSQMQNSHIGCIAQREPPTRGVLNVYFNYHMFA